MCIIEESPGSLPMQSEKYPGLTVEIKRNEVTSAERILGSGWLWRGAMMRSSNLGWDRLKLWQVRSGRLPSLGMMRKPYVDRDG